MNNQSNQQKLNIRKARNKKYKTIIKNTIKKIKIELNSKNSEKEKINLLFIKLQKASDTAAGKKIIHKNKSGRIKSRIIKLINSYNL